MTRKPIPDDTQNIVLLKSRRRCCLCFWLKGIDDVQPGQIAHLDQDNENSNEDNLVFLCLNHHDEYDGKTSQSKGLREKEVRRWRDELYLEIGNRFRSFQLKALHFEIGGIGIIADRETTELKDHFTLRFRLKNVGQAAIWRPVISIGLPDNVNVRRETFVPLPFGRSVPLPNCDRSGFAEIREDFFELKGRVASISPLPLMAPILLPDHSAQFSGLVLEYKDYPPGTRLILQSRVDAEDMQPMMQELSVEVPPEIAEELNKKVPD